MQQNPFAVMDGQQGGGLTGIRGSQTIQNKLEGKCGNKVHKAIKLPAPRRPRNQQMVYCVIHYERCAIHYELCVHINIKMLPKTAPQMWKAASCLECVVLGLFQSSVLIIGNLKEVIFRHQHKAAATAA